VTVGSPKVNDRADRDHWPDRGFSLRFFPSERVGAWPTSLPVSPAGFVAIVHPRMEIDPAMTQRVDPFDAHGGIPIRDVIASCMSGLRAVAGRPRSFVDCPRFSQRRVESARVGLLS